MGERGRITTHRSGHIGQVIIPGSSVAVLPSRRVGSLAALRRRDEEVASGYEQMILLLWRLSEDGRPWGDWCLAVLSHVGGIGASRDAVPVAVGRGRRVVSGWMRTEMPMSALVRAMRVIAVS